MIINSTDIKNNFGKYIRLAAKEDIIITKNGRTVGKLVACQEEAGENRETVRENAAAYNYDRRKVSYEEFLEISANSEERYEYIDGEIYLLASPKTTHQKILLEMSSAFYNWFKGKKCTPMIAPYDIKLKRNESNKNLVQPDLMVICDLEEKLGADDYYTGVPALMVEIISQSTKSKDYVRKLDLYMCCGVSEYWIVNPDSGEVHVHLFKDGDIFTTKTFPFAEEIKSFYFEGLTLSLRDFAKDR
jgi:prevent-host-death family protein